MQTTDAYKRCNINANKRQKTQGNYRTTRKKYQNNVFPCYQQ